MLTVPLLLLPPLVHVEQVIPCTDGGHFLASLNFPPRTCVLVLGSIHAPEAGMLVRRIGQDVFCA